MSPEGILHIVENNPNYAKAQCSQKEKLTEMLGQAQQGILPVAEPQRLSALFPDMDVDSEPALNISPDLAKLFGGILIFSNYMSLAHSLRQDSTEIYPFVRFDSVHKPEKLIQLRKLLGLPELPQPDETVDYPTRLRVSRRKAVAIANAIQPYAPTREVEVKYFQRWDNSTPDEYEQIYAEYEQEQRGIRHVELNLSIEDYSQMFDDLNFLAGFFAWNASQYLVDKQTQFYRDDQPVIHSRHRVGFEVVSRNFNMVQALYKKFLGNRPVRKTGRDSYRWRIEGSDYYRLLDQIALYTRGLIKI